MYFLLESVGTALVGTIVSALVPFMWLKLSNTGRKVRNQLDQLGLNWVGLIAAISAIACSVSIAFSLFFFMFFDRLSAEEIAKVRILLPRITHLHDEMFCVENPRSDNVATCFARDGNVTTFEKDKVEEHPQPGITNPVFEMVKKRNRETK